MAAVEKSSSEYSALRSFICTILTVTTDQNDIGQKQIPDFSL